MLVTARQVLADAQARRYAVPAFDCVEDVWVRAILETAEACRAPVFLMCLEPDVAGNGWVYFAGLVRAVAAHHPIPIVLHLDHTTSLDTIRNGISKINVYADCRIAMRRGLERAAASQQRQDPLPHEVFGPIQEQIAAVVKEKIEQMFAAGRWQDPDGRKDRMPIG